LYFIYVENKFFPIRN